MENFTTACEACCWWFIVRRVMLKRLWASGTAPTRNIWLRWCVKGVKRRRGRGREKALPNAQLLSSAFFHGFLERNEQKTHFLHATLKRSFSLPTYPDCGIFLMPKKKILSVQQKPIGREKINRWMSNRMSHSNSGLDSSCRDASSVKNAGFDAEEWKAEK